MSPLEFEDILHHLAEGVAPGTIIIVKLFDDITSEEEQAEGETPPNIYDQFQTDPSPIGGGSIQDAILMDNPLQS